jgi:hypothetical protein
MGPTRARSLGAPAQNHRAALLSALQRLAWAREPGCGRPRLVGDVVELVAVAHLGASRSAPALRYKSLE